MRWPPPEDWPHRALSRQILSRPHRWHVQQAGRGPTLILLHGAGASAHSFAGLLPLLAQTHHAVAVDLPGQGFTQLGARHRCGLAEMAQDLAALIAQEGWQPAALIGHSAGGALALRLASRLDPMPAVIGINPALGPFPGLAGLLFPAMAKLLSLTPGVAGAVARHAATPARVRALIQSTGSTLSEAALAPYCRLMADPAHVDATLLMMAQWELAPLLHDLPRLGCATLLLAGEADSAVPPHVADAAARRMPQARAERLAGLGHLAHEEDPARILQSITGFLATQPAMARAPD